MNALNEFLTNSKATSKLKPRCYLTTSLVGMLIVTN
jgi:hypothetical protein